MRIRYPCNREKPKQRRKTKLKEFVKLMRVTNTEHVPSSPVIPTA